MTKYLIFCNLTYRTLIFYNLDGYFKFNGHLIFHLLISAEALGLVRQLFYMQFLNCLHNCENSKIVRNGK